MISTVRELSSLVAGEVCGDGEQHIVGACPIDEAAPGYVTLLDCDRDTSLLADCTATAVVCSIDVPHGRPCLIRVADPFSAFVTIARHLHERPLPVPSGVDSRAFVDATAIVGTDSTVNAFAAIHAEAHMGHRCRIYSGAVVGRGCRLGDDVTLHPNAVLYPETVLGNRVTIHANAVVGADGFGYRLQDGRHVKVPQLGHVEVGDDVEIGACTTIDRGTFGPTRIGQGTKIDNLVMIAHNCQIGRHNIFVSQMGMAGSSGTGDYVVIAGQVGVVDHVRIGDRCTIGGQAAVTKDVSPGQRLLGSPATPEREQKKMLMSLASLPELRKTVRRIVRHLGLVNDEVTDDKSKDRSAA